MVANRQESSRAVGFVTILPSECHKKKKLNAILLAEFRADAISSYYSTVYECMNNICYLGTFVPHIKRIIRILSVLQKCNITIMQLNANNT